VRRLLALLVVAALGAPIAAAPVAPAAAAAKPKYCKKKPSKLTKKQRKRCKTKRRTPTHSTSTPPAPDPATDPPVTPPVVEPPAEEPVDPTTPTPPLGRLGVRAEEFKLTLSRTQLSPGAALVELQNFGEDPHDLRIAPTGGGALAASFPEIDPGTRHKEQVAFPAGTYKLYCSLPGHEGLGMRATLTVAPSAP
jgi:plastocyanin